MSPTKNVLIDHLTIVLLAMLLWSLPLHAAPVTTIFNSGSSENRVDIVIMGDGYTAAELGKYASDVQNFIDGMFAEMPYAQYLLYFNIHRIDVVSAESGADHPERGVFVDTALDATYNCAGIQRRICVNGVKVNQVLAESVSAAQRDMIIILVNDPEYGGSGGAVAVASTHPAVIEIVLHETGHSHGQLADEYVDEASCNATFEPREVNVAKDALKWAHWIDVEPIPSNPITPGLVGWYEGAKYCSQGLFRNTPNNKMRSLGVPFESVNVEQLVRRIYNLVSPIDAVTPAPGDLMVEANSSVAFAVEHPQPLSHDLAFEWLVNGALHSTEATFNLSTGGPGTITVELRVSDPTALVRHDPENLLTDTRQWTVAVPSQEPPSLALIVNQSRFVAGETLTVDLHMQNPGPALTVDVYVGAILADGHTTLWMTETNPVQGVIGDFGDNPATFTPLLQGVTWPMGLDVIQEDYLTYTWNGGEGFGNYHILVGWTVPDSLADGSVDDGDVLALAWTVVTLEP